VIQKFSFISLSLVLCLLLAACTTSGPEIPEICPLPTGPCTPAPQKATSRPYQINGIWYYPQQHYEYDEIGLASYYGGGDVFHGRPTATGEVFDMNGVTGAHKTLPLPCIAEITNLENGRQINIKMNDRGPFVEGRIVDVSRRVSQLLGFEMKGTARVRVRTLVPQSLALNNIDPSTVMLASAQTSSPQPLPPTPLPSSIPPSPPVLASNPSIADQIEKCMLASASSPSISRPTSAPPPVSSPPSSTPHLSNPKTKGIFVDVGAYDTPGEANTASHTLAGVANSPTQSVKNQGPKPYAVRVGPFASMSTANEILDQLLEAGHRTSRIVIHR